MTESPSRDLLDWGLAARQTQCIVLSCKVPDQSGHTVICPQPSEDFFEECGLARAGTGDQAHHEHSGSTKTLAQTPRHDVILLQYFLSDFDQTGFGTHSCISNATTSSSFPCTISEQGVPHSAQQNICSEHTGRCARQPGQKIATETSSTSNREPWRDVPSQAIS